MPIKLNLNPFKSGKTPASSPLPSPTAASNLANPLLETDYLSNAPPPYSRSQSIQQGLDDVKDQKVDPYMHDAKDSPKATFTSVSGSSKGNEEDALMALKRHDIVFLIDDSPSMDQDGLWLSLNEALIYRR
jgi:hypothetical protein